MTSPPMTRTSLADDGALAELLERVEACSGPDRELDARLSAAFQIIPAMLHSLGSDWSYEYRVSDDCLHVEAWAVKAGEQSACQARRAPDCVTASLDAALALVERVLPGWTWSVGNLRTGGQAYLMRAQGAVLSGGPGATPTLALLAALLRSLIAESPSLTEASDEG